MTYCPECGRDLDKLGALVDFAHFRADMEGHVLCVMVRKFQIRYKGWGYWVLTLPYNNRLMETQVICIGFERAVYEFNKELKKLI